MNRHLPGDLPQMQSLPLEAKITMTKLRIQQWYDHWLGEVYVSFSGGKDSTVLKHIVDSMYKDVPALFVNTGLEYPEIQRFVKDIKDGKYPCFNSDVEIVRPEMRFDEVIKKYGYPVVSKEVAQKIYEYRKNPNGYAKDRFVENSDYVQKYGKAYCLSKWVWLRDSDIPISHQCCNVMKKRPSKKYEKESGRKPIIGTLAEESRSRKTAWIRHGCNAFNGKRPTSQPLSFWTEQDILHYIKLYDVPYCPVYGDIVVKPADPDVPDNQMDIADYLGEYTQTDKLMTTGCYRTGCVYCAFGIHLEAGENRFQRLKRTHPRQWEYCIKGGEMVDGKWQPSKEGLGLGKVLDYIGVKYE